MKKLNLAKPGRSWPRGILGLCAVLLALVLLAMTAVNADLSATSGLFQSPQTATAQPTVATLTPELPTASPTPEPAVTMTEPVTPLPSSTPSPTFTESPTTGIPEELPPTEPRALPSEEAATAEALPTATEQPTESPEESEAETPQRYADSESVLRFDWGMLFDSLALGLSYAWLCCGVVLIVVLPILFVALWSRGRREQEPQEDD